MKSSLILIVGLGNPGEIYKRTRHNIGFYFVEHISRILSIDFHRNLSMESLIAIKKFDQQKIFLQKPLNYMNLSGLSVSKLANFYKISAEQIIICHDELDLDPGTVRLKKSGGNAGHNGLKSVEKELGNTNFWRLRIGIGHPRRLNLKKNVADFVLSTPEPQEKNAIDEAIEIGVSIIKKLFFK